MRQLPNLLFFYTQLLSQPSHHKRYIARLVTFPTMRHRCQVWGVSLDQNPLPRYDSSHPCHLAILICRRPTEPKHQLRPLLANHLRLIHTPRKTVQRPLRHTPSQTLQYLHQQPHRLPAMYRHGQRPLMRIFQLPPQHLHLLTLPTLIPMQIQPYLPHSHRLMRPAKLHQPLRLFHRTFPKLRRMKPIQSKTRLRILPTRGSHSPRVTHITRWQYHPCHAYRLGTTYHLPTIAIKRLLVDMCMCINHSVSFSP